MTGLREGMALLALAIGGAELCAQQPRRTADSVAATAALAAWLRDLSADSLAIHAPDARTPSSSAPTRAAQYIAAAASRMGLVPLPGSNGMLQHIPLVHRQFRRDRLILRQDGEASRDGALVREDYSATFLPAVHFLPIAGAEMPGFPDSRHVRLKRVVYGGKLGSPGALTPDRARDRIVIFAAPERPVGRAAFAVWEYTAHLRAYEAAAAVLVTSLDITPASVTQRLMQGSVALQNDSRPRATLPATASISHATATLLLRQPVSTLHPGDLGNYATFRYEMTEARMPDAVNVVAVLAGRDGPLAHEYVVATAQAEVAVPSADATPGALWSFNRAPDRPSQHPAGHALLLAVAQQFASRPVRPELSLAFVWTAEEVHPGIGWSAFVHAPPVRRDRIRGTIELDVIGVPANHVRGTEPTLAVSPTTVPPFDRRAWDAMLLSVARPGWRIEPRGAAPCDASDRTIPGLRISTEQIGLERLRGRGLDDLALTALADVGDYFGLFVQHFANHVMPADPSVAPDPGWSGCTQPFAGR